MKAHEATVGAALSEAEKFLGPLGRREARASAEALMMEILNCDRARLYLGSGDHLESRKRKIFLSGIRLRQKRTPLAYILGKAYFWDEALLVDKGCLIPRPETEILVEKFIATSGFGRKDFFSFLDMGAGSGAIGLALLRHYENAHAVFADVSVRALAVTGKNIARFGLGARAEILKTNLFQALDGRCFDAVVCNPPYLSAKDFKKLQPEVAREPRAALDGGPDGLDFYRKLASEAPEFLNPGGFLFLEVGAGQALRVRGLLKQNGFWDSLEIFKDLARINRVVKGKVLAGSSRPLAA